MWLWLPVILVVSWWFLQRLLQWFIHWLEDKDGDYYDDDHFEP